jgi:hypothetical protein
LAWPADIRLRIQTVPQLFDEICRLVAEGYYLIGDHAWERLLERGIME